jgi:hypothetical protein
MQWEAMDGQACKFLPFPVFYRVKMGKFLPSDPFSCILEATVRRKKVWVQGMFPWAKTKEQRPKKVKKKQGR